MSWVVCKGATIPPSANYSIDVLDSFTYVDFLAHDVIKSSYWQERSISMQIDVVHEQTVGNAVHFGFAHIGQYRKKAYILLQYCDDF